MEQPWVIPISMHMNWAACKAAFVGKCNVNFPQFVVTPSPLSIIVIIIVIRKAGAARSILKSNCEWNVVAAENQLWCARRSRKQLSWALQGSQVHHQLRLNCVVAVQHRAFPVLHTHLITGVWFQCSCPSLRPSVSGCLCVREQENSE